MSVKAITPDEALKSKFENHVPDEVLEAANECIAKNLNSYGISKFTQTDLVDLILEKMPEMNQDRIFKEKWLDLEPFYRAAGWKVVYDKPGWNETGAATFEFSKKKSE
jgi:hypothetical protein